MDDDEDLWTDAIPDLPWSWKRLLAVGVTLVSNLTAEVAEALDCVSNLILQDVDFDADRKMMHEQAALELEMLVAGEEGDAPATP